MIEVLTWLAQKIDLFANETPRQTRQKGDVLPLPVLSCESLKDRDAAKRWRGEVSCDDGEEIEMVDLWLRVVVRGLNLHDGKECVWSTPTQLQLKCLNALWVQCFEFVQLEGLDFSDPADWEALLRSRYINYEGECVAKAECLTWHRMEPALPPIASCGIIPAVSLATGGILDYLRRPECALFDLRHLKARPAPGKVNIAQHERTLVAGHLVSRRLCSLLYDSELVWIQGLPLVNGLFGVEKPGSTVHTLDGASSTCLRLIMNLTASNSVMRACEGNTACLPSLSAWRGVIMQSDEYLLCSWEDLKGCFYLISMDGWEKYFAFNLAFKGDALSEIEKMLLESGSALPEMLAKVRAARDSGQRLWLCSRVIPMGWKNAVGIVQALHRELLLESNSSRRGESCGVQDTARAGLPLRQEARRDRFLPPLTMTAQWRQMWQVYIDDFDLAELFLASQLSEIGSVSKVQMRVRSAYQAWSAPRSENKAGSRALKATRLGMAVDGETGRLGVPGKKLSRLLLLTRHCMQRGAMTLHTWQVLMGHWVHVLVARRETMSVFSEVWQRMQKWRQRCLPLGSKCQREFCIALCHLPLMHVSLRWQLSDLVSASDASETGGGLTVASQLTHLGEQEVKLLEETPVAWGRDEIMVITLNDEVGSVRRAFHRVGLEVSLLACFVQRPGVEDMLRQSLGDAVCVKTLKDLKDWLGKEVYAHPRISHVLVCGLVRDHRDVKLMSDVLLFFRSEYMSWHLQSLSLSMESVGRWCILPSWTCSQSVVGVTKARFSCHSGVLDRVSVEKMEEDLGLTRHATGGLLPSHLQRQLQQQWLQARVKLLENAAPVEVLTPFIEAWAKHQGFRRPAFGPAYGMLSSHETLMRHLLCRASPRGSDVRVSTGALLDPRCWPRESVDPRWWAWTVVLSYPLSGEHINALEMRAVLMMHRWRLRHGQAIGLRYVPFVDSAVCLAVMTKGRSSSRKLNYVLRKLNSRILASCSLPSYCYVRTFYNPADAPSRWRDRKRARLEVGTLRSRRVAPATLKRYKEALALFNQWLRLSHLQPFQRVHLLVQYIADFLELLWHSGAPKGKAGDLLSSLQLHLPASRGRLQEPWALYKTWTKLELPTRTVPLPWVVVATWINWCLSQGRLRDALALWLGFDALLRASELTNLLVQDVTVSLSRSSAVLSLRSTKSGVRMGVTESVVVNDVRLVWLLAAQVSKLPPEALLLGHTYGSLHGLVMSLSSHFALSRFYIRTHSLRRGGATHHFVRTGSLSATQLRGRWASQSSARQYIDSAMSETFLQELSTSEQGVFSQGANLLAARLRASFRVRGNSNCRLAF
eukprot:6490729-Amphidinium_carterae.1